MVYIISGIAVALLLFIAWRWTSVGRGVRQRDESILKLIDPIGLKLDEGKTVTKEEVLEIARRPETRFMLYSGLNAMNQTDLIPSCFNSSIEQAESALAYWLMHPNEFRESPEKIEHLQLVTTKLNGENVKFHVFRFRMPDGHWASKNGWLLGLAGPTEENAKPYTIMPGAFSRGPDTEKTITPQRLVQWYIDMLKKKDLAN